MRMSCPKCGGSMGVDKTRSYARVVVRYRKCSLCGTRARTEEHIRRVPNMVRRCGK